MHRIEIPQPVTFSALAQIVRKFRFSIGFTGLPRVLCFGDRPCGFFWDANLLVTPHKITIESLCMDHHGPTHAITMANQLLKGGLAFQTIGIRVCVIQFDIAGIQNQIAYSGANLRRVRQLPGLLKLTKDSSYQIVAQRGSFRSVDQSVELCHWLLGRSEGLSEKIIDDTIDMLGLIDVPENPGCHIIAQAVRAPVVAGFSGHEPGPFGIKFRNAAPKICKVRSAGLAGKIVVPRKNSVVFPHPNSRSLLRPAGDEFIHTVASLNERRCNAYDYIWMHTNRRRWRMVVVGIHADVFVIKLEVDGLCNLIGQRQSPVTDTAQRLTSLAFTPPPAITWIH